MSRSKKFRKIFFAVLATLAIIGGLSACHSTANQKQVASANTDGNTAIAMWGNAPVTHFTEYHLAIETYALRDDANLVTYLYEQEGGASSDLICMGTSTGCGLSYATQVTPSETGDEQPVREPDALFLPDSSDAWWMQVTNPATHQTQIGLINGTMRVWPFELPCVQPGSTTVSLGA